MTIISWSQQILTGMTQQCWSDCHQLKSVELNSRAELGPYVSCVVPAGLSSSTGMQDLWSELAWGGRCLTGGPFCACAHSPEAHLMCTSRSGVWLHLRLTARPDPGHAQESTVLGGHLVSHSLDLQSVHSLLPGPLLLWRWLCFRVNYMWLDQILHTVLVSSKDWVWLSSLRC